MVLGLSTQECPVRTAEVDVSCVGGWNPGTLGRVYPGRMAEVKVGTSWDILGLSTQRTPKQDS